MDLNYSYNSSTWFFKFAPIVEMRKLKPCFLSKKRRLQQPVRRFGLFALPLINTEVNSGQFTEGKK